MGDVVVHGLTINTLINGRKGTLEKKNVGDFGKRFLVKLSDGNGKCSYCNILPKNLKSWVPEPPKEYRTGLIVKIHGLGRSAQFNNCHGVTTTKLNEKGRYHVKIIDISGASEHKGKVATVGKEIALQPKNLKRLVPDDYDVLWAMQEFGVTGASKDCQRVHG